MYVHARENGPRSWRDSNQECQGRGGYLASLNTRESGGQVVEVLQMRTSPKPAFIGLHGTPSVLPRHVGHAVYVRACE